MLKENRVEPTSHAVMDHEHQVQTGLLKALCEAVEAGRGADEIEEILWQLITFSEAHFMSEELLMRLASYDDYDDHIADHVRMMDELGDIALRHKTGQSSLVLGKAHAALDFILAHIETRDRRFADWSPR